MGKIRINDLARELEVKSRVILDALLAVGFTEHKTHSSAVDDDVAEKVRQYLKGGSTAPVPASSGEAAVPPAAASTGVPAVPPVVSSEAPEVESKSTVAPAPAAEASASAPPKEAESKMETTSARPASAPAEAATPVPSRIQPAIRPAPPVAPGGPVKPGPKMPVAPSRPVYKAPAAPVAPVSRPSGTQPPVAQRPPLAPPAPSAPPTAGKATQQPGIRPAPRLTPAAPRITPAPPRPLTPHRPVAGQPGGEQQPPVQEAPRFRTPSLKVAPQSPVGATGGTGHRRLIVPVAPERPKYEAPPPVEKPRPIPGQPIRTAGAGGRPAPGRPIYQRPGAPGGRPPMGGRGAAPGGAPADGRRPMHPTRSGAPAGGRGAVPGRGGQHHDRREGRQKEGPLKFQRVPRTANAGPMATNTAITISEGITVKELSERLGLRAKDVIRKLLDKGLMVTVNQTLDTDIATQLARDFGAEASVVSFEEEALREVEQTAGVVEEGGGQVPRAPVVTIMGHVDHGKTSLLDAIRETSVATGEAGGITQHIGAYKVEISDKESPAFGRKVVFIDTPGHEAFTRMRARGARVTDIVVLVVAADDGVMPQTLEAMDHAKAAGVPILVAINKIDKPEAQPDRVKKQLADRGLMPEDWGGTTVMVPVSAKSRINLNLLLEMILLVADMQELKANPDRPGQGTVLEAQLDRGRGPVARVLVQNGTLRHGDTLVIGSVMGRVRAMFDDRGRGVSEAGPSTPVEVLGLDSTPEAGDSFLVINDRYKAKQIALYREEKLREATLSRSSRLNLEALSRQLAAGDVKELPLIIKTDVQGSEEVLVDTISRLSTDKVKIRIIRSGVGAPTEYDVLLASASNAVVIGFNVKPERKAVELAEHEKVDIRLYSIIYELTEEIQKAMHGLLEPTYKENVIGHAEVQQTFRIPKAGTVAGCQVRDGRVTRDAQVRVMRGGTEVFTGKMGSLRRFKDDVKEVTSGMECGIGVANFNDIQAGDILEAFTVERVASTL